MSAFDRYVRTRDEIAASREQSLMKANQQRDALLRAAKLAADALLNADPGNPEDETGWANEESLNAWLALRAAIAKAEGRS